MSILLSGDFHNNVADELNYINKNALLKKYTQTQYDEIKYHIILGDAGFLWHGNKGNEAKIYKKLSMRPFPILCVLGNHDPVLGRSDLPEVDIGIGENVILVKEENPFVAYLKRGKVYKIENHKFLVLGGALSIDKHSRRPGISWWEEEYWSEDEKNNLFLMLESEKEFDYVLSHTGPNCINMTVYNICNTGFTKKFRDEVAELNESIDEKIFCKQWFCGHWHLDIGHYDELSERSYQYLYKQTVLLDRG